jgi:hypothetical protein
MEDGETLKIPGIYWRAVESPQTAPRRARPSESRILRLASIGYESRAAANPARCGSAEETAVLGVTRVRCASNRIVLPKSI